MKFAKRALAALLGLCLLMSTGCNGQEKKQEGTPDAKKAMGRYIEETMPLPEQKGRLLKVCVNGDQTLDYFSTGWNDMTGRTAEFFHYRYSGDQWQAQDTAWADAIFQANGGKGKIGAVARSKDGSLFAVLRYGEPASLHLYRVADGKTEEIRVPHWDETYRPKNDSADGVEVYDGTQEEFGVADKSGRINGAELSPKDMTVLENGDILIQFFGYGVCRYSPDGALQKEYSGEGSSFYTDGKTLGIVGYDKIVKTCQLDTGVSGNSIDVGAASSSMSPTVAAGADGALYVCSAAGINRMAPGGSVWETLVDGALSTLSVPSYSVASFAPDGQNGFYLALANMSGQVDKMIHSVYSADTPTVPDTVLTLYALNDSPVLRQAMGVFRQAHPEVLVDLQIGLDEAGTATKNDVIRALNTELLAGRGPDILILDGLPADSYVEKGVLEDISGILPDGLIAGPNASYQKDGKTFAIPARFTLPVMCGPKELLDQINSITDLTKDYEGPVPLFAADDPAYLLNLLAGASSPSWQKENGELDTEKLTEFLESAKTLYERYNNGGEAEQWGLSYTSSGNENTGYAIPYNVLKYGVYSSRLSMINANSLSMLFSCLYQSGQMVDENGNQQQEYQMYYNSAAPLAGQVEGAFFPVASAGICASSGQKENAREFIQTLLSPEVQDYIFNDGFPVRSDSLQKAIDRELQSQKDLYMILKEADSAYAKERRMEDSFRPESLFENLKTPVRTDSVLLDAVITEGGKCLKGAQSVDETVKAVVSATALHLQEQS